MAKQIIIAGAGLTGLIAAHAFRGSQVHEAATEEDVSRNEHAALLRFRSDAVSKITGIPFREVTVQKSVWDFYSGRHVQLDLALANAYARKVLAATGGKISGRSIWNMESVKRFIAPPDFIASMRDNVRSQIHYQTPLDLRWRWGNKDCPTISTIPMPTLLWLAAERSSWDVLPEFKFEKDEFKCAAIHVERHRLEGVDLHQTIYVPCDMTDTYRVSITGDVLIIESVGESRMSVEQCIEAFGLLGVSHEFVDAKEQRYGKIVDVPASRRRQLLRRLTEHGNVYSLGRFATWRNVLLDDVAKDIEVIRRMISADAYGRELM